MDLLVPTTTIAAKDLQRHDVIVEMPREGIEPWRGRWQVRRIAIGDTVGTVTIDLRFPPTANCRPGCDADPRTCRHYGQGGGMFKTVPADEEEVIVIRP